MPTRYTCPSCGSHSVRYDRHTLPNGDVAYELTCLACDEFESVVSDQEALAAMLVRWGSTWVEDPAAEASG